MDVKDKMAFFQELINCNYKIYFWNYTPEMTLIETNCPAALIAGNAVSLLNFSGSLKKYIQDGGRYPFILETALNMLYIAGFLYQDRQLEQICLLGPAFTGRNSHLLFKKELDQRDLSAKLRSAIFRQIGEVPIIPSAQLFQYAVMFHYCLTGEKITSNEIQFPSGESSTAFDEIQLVSEEHYGIWLAEQALLQMFREGNPDYKRALERTSFLNGGIRFDTGDSLRQQKNSVIILLALCSRAVMAGGLNPSIAYSLNDYYVQMLEDCKTISALSSLARTMMDDFIQRVRDSKKESSLSRQIQCIRDYISMHPAEKFSISELAGRTGYTEYYFSHKFKKETGVSVADYIRNVKIRQAKLLLSGTQMSIREISNELGFSSSSYFSSTFQKLSGLSPSEYRMKNSKL